MRTGAIFARGSCRALKWMALFGVVFALGAGQAAAQTTINVEDVTVIEKAAGNKVEEGALLTVRVTLDQRVPRATGDTPATVTVTLTETIASGAAGDMGNAEAEDVTLPGDTGSGITVIIPEQASTGNLNIVTGRDLDAVDEKFQLTAVVSDVAGTQDGGGATLAVGTETDVFNGVIDDAQEQDYELKVTTRANDIKEGSSIDLTLRAVPDRPANEDVTLFLQLSDTTQYEIADPDTTGPLLANTRVLSSTATLLDVEIMSKDSNDKNRTDDPLTLEAFTGTVGRGVGRESVSITVLDIHKLPEAKNIEAEARDNEKYADGMMVTSVAEGGMAYVWVEVTNTTRDAVSDDEKFTISLMAADQSQLLDFRVSPASRETMARGEFTSSGDDTEMVGPFTLEALSDEDIGEEELMLYVNLMGESRTYGAGESNGMFSITIEDTTKPMVWAKSQEDIEAAVYAAKGEGAMSPGDSFELMTSDLFEMAESVNVAYSASSDGDAATASASASMVTVTAVEPGMAHVTVTATASMASGAKPLPQTVSNIAQVIFPVTVELSELSVTVTADPMEIMEGGMSTITAMASREVAANDGEVKVDLQVVGDGELSAASITIEAGEMMGTATVTAMEDDEDYEDETLTVVATGAGSATLPIMVTDNDEAPEPTNSITAKSSDDIAAVLMAAGLGDDDMFNPGMMAMVDASMLFDVMEGYSASYSAESDDMAAASASVSGSMVTVTAGTAGHAHIVITGTATMASGIEIVSGQPATNVATVLFSVNVTDTALEITVSTDPMDMVEEGGMITVTATANRDVVAADGTVEVMLTITGAVEMNEATIAIAAGSTGSAMVQVLDDMEVAPMADITIVATGSGITTAQTFTISVTENDSARTFTLSGPDDMNLVEGMEYELTVTADPAVSADTEVMIMRDRSASTADDSDYMVENITIMAGEASGSTMLMVTEDEMDDSGAHMNEVLVLFATADNTQTNSLEFNLWDAAVPALPVIAQLLLAAFLAIGGYRRYQRR